MIFSCRGEQSKTPAGCEKSGPSKRKTRELDRIVPKPLAIRSYVVIVLNLPRKNGQRHHVWQSTPLSSDTQGLPPG